MAISSRIIALPIGVACRLTISTKVIHEIVMQKYKNLRKPYDRAQQTIFIFDNW